MAVDWRALLRSDDPTLADKLNRGFFSVKQDLLNLQALLAELQADVDAGNIPSGAAGGQLGGTYPDPDVRGLRETAGPTLLTLGAVADGDFFKRSGSTVVGGSPVSTAGGVMSMVGPGGAAAPVVAYDFTRYDPSLTDAQNLAAANLSGNSAYDLTAHGSARIDYLSLSGDTGQSPFAWTPMAVRSDGGALLTGRQTDYVTGSGSPAGLQLLGALSIEWLGYVTEQPGATGDMFMWDFSAAGETEAANVLYLLRWACATGAWTYDHESSAGTDSTRVLLTTSLASIADMLFNPALITLTRAPSTGSLNFYINGRKVFTANTAGPNALPTGGTTSNLSLGFGHTTSKAEILGFRIFNTELTAAQVRESYQRTFFGITA